MPDRVVIFSSMPGVGKTTITVNLACQMARSGSVQLIDADEFGSASRWGSYGKLPVLTKSCPLLHPHQAQQWTQTLSAIDDDFLVIDLPSHCGQVCVTALLIADLVVVPIQASYYGLHAGKFAIENLRRVLSSKQDRAPTVLLIPSQVGFSREGREVEASLPEIGEEVGPSVGWRAAFEASAAEYDWVGATAPRSRAHQEIVALTATVHRIVGR